MALPSRHISQTIKCDPTVVAEFAANPVNLPLWAHGLSGGIRNVEGRWVTDSPMGTVEVRFCGGTEFGVLDHDVIFPDGSQVHNPLRVLHNDGYAEVVFTLYRQPNTALDDYEQDAAFVVADLERLRDHLEGNHLASRD